MCLHPPNRRPKQNGTNTIPLLMLHGIDHPRGLCPFPDMEKWNSQKREGKETQQRGQGIEARKTDRDLPPTKLARSMMVPRTRDKYTLHRLGLLTTKQIKLNKHEPTYRESSKGKPPTMRCKCITLRSRPALPLLARGNKPEDTPTARPWVHTGTPPTRGDM